MTNPQPPHGANGSAPGSPRSGLSPVALAVAVLRHWPLVLATALLAVLGAVGYGLLRKPVYSAQTLLFMSQSQSDPRSQLAAQLPMAGLGMGTPANVKLVNTILGSRSLADSVARRAGAPEDFQYAANPDGSIRISVEHPDPEAAARIANEYPRVLNLLVSRTGAQTNGQKELLLERQIVAARERLEESEEQLVRYQTRTNSADVQEQSSATLNAAVQLQGRIAEKEAELAALRRTATPDNPRLRAAVADVGELRRQLQGLSTGGAGRVLLPLREGPALRVGAARVLREYTRNEQIYVALNAALAQAQIELNSSLPVVTVVDPAPVPRMPEGPGLPTLVVVAGVLGLVAGAGVAVVVQLVRDARRDPERDPFRAVAQGVSSGRSFSPRAPAHR